MNLCIDKSLKFTAAIFFNAKHPLWSINNAGIKTGACVSFFVLFSMQLTSKQKQLKSCFVYLLTDSEQKLFATFKF